MTEVPVVMVTAKREPKDLEAGFQAGANDYLTKPYVRQELLQRVKAHASVGRMTRSMQRYVPQPFATLLGRKHLTDIELGDSVDKDLAVLFLDVRGFTQAAERMTSRQVFSWLNDQFGVIVPALHAEGGVVDKYLGDAVMALFPGGAGAALAGAVAAAKALRASPGGASVGMGIHHGVTMLGALGEPTRLAPTVVSDTVNVAARLESLTRRFGAAALVSGEALDAAGRAATRTRFLGTFRLKGRAKALRVHEVLDAAPPDVAEARLRSGAHVSAVLDHLEARRFGEALAAAERGLDAHPEDAVLAFYVAAMDGICGAGAPYDGAIELGEK
jgi:two-component system sensor histidine kinase ChiS